MVNLKICEILQSISGEVSAFHQGRITNILRLQGCNLRCPYCDASQALNKEEGSEMSISAINSSLNHTFPVMITGGEPFMQEEALSEFIKYRNYLIGPRYIVETNGTINPSYFPVEQENISIVADYKLDFEKKMNLGLYSRLTEKDWIKFVVSNEAELDRAHIQMKLLQKITPCNFAISPCEGTMKPALLAGFMISKRIDAVLNLQIHKIINMG
jgi:7-carboxy-7-deazaguanine synthase